MRPAHSADCASRRAGDRRGASAAGAGAGGEPTRRLIPSDPGAARRTVSPPAACAARCLSARTPSPRSVLPGRHCDRRDRHGRVVAHRRSAALGRASVISSTDRKHVRAACGTPSLIDVPCCSPGVLFIRVTAIVEVLRRRHRRSGATVCPARRPPRARAGIGQRVDRTASPGARCRVTGPSSPPGRRVRGRVRPAAVLPLNPARTQLGVHVDRFPAPPADGCGAAPPGSRSSPAPDPVDRHDQVIMVAGPPHGLPRGHASGSACTWAWPAWSRAARRPGAASHHPARAFAGRRPGHREPNQ